LVGNHNGHIWLYLNIGTRTHPTLTKVGKIKANGSDIDVGNNAAPVVNDWNNDGRKDLIVGSQDNDIRVYLNTGENSAPTFEDYFIIENVSHYHANPDVVDLDSDGKKDLLVGDDDGYVYFYENVGSDASPIFTYGERLKDLIDLKVNKEARVETHDWNEDGNIDLLVGQEEGFISVFFNIKTMTPLENDPQIVNPTDYVLNQNYPNPFNPKTTISYQLPAQSRVDLSIYNVYGQKIVTLLEAIQIAGNHKVEWNANSYPSGVYFYKLISGTRSYQKKMLLVK